MPEIVCPECQSSVPTEDVNLARLLAKCRRCQTVFQFGDQAPELAARKTRRPRSRPSHHLPLPPGMWRDETSVEPRFVIRWYTHAVWFLALFCLFWDGLLVVWYSATVATGMWFLALFAVGHLAVGLGLTYLVLCAFLNRTRITVDRLELTVRYGPLPTFSNVTVASSDIDQVYVTRPDPRRLLTVDQQRRFSTESRRNMSIGKSYEVQVRLRDGSTQRLLWTTSLDQAHFLEQQIESYLMIVDRPMPGEV